MDNEEFEQTGPYEPITTRIRNILKEYKEGIGVFKELIQNADDAGASTVRFLVDWRRGPRATLLGPNMASCQGPALWAYNDAVFTEKDFENINKLAGETKVSEFNKIGRFGLGFNAVYHVTDVPSIVSGECCVIFDPNVTHLENHIRDKSRPGIRINLCRKPQTLTKFRDQFQPYNRIFGCRTQRGPRQHFHYDGTLFRFPFRTQSEAEQSEICQTVYDKKKIEELAKSLKECASFLLLFLQHVKKVELYELASDSGSPDKKHLLLSVSKSDQHEKHETFVDEYMKWWKSMLSTRPPSGNGPSRSGLVSIETKVNVSDLISSAEKSVKQESWLVASCVGTGLSVQLARTKEGQAQALLPCASVAVQLEKVDSGPPSNFRVASTTLAGEAFCFLPLSIPTGLPVHVNAYFAIMSNRMEIWKRDTSSTSQPIEVQWNESLLQDALANAYVKLLEAARDRVLSGVLESSYEFHSFWPRYNDLTTTTWRILVKSVYQKLVSGSLPLFRSNKKWISINDGWVLCDQIFRHDSRQHFVDILTQLGKPVFLLPPAVLESLRKTGNENVLSRQTLSLKRFLNDFLLPNITTISSKNRDAVICFALDYIVDYLDTNTEGEAGSVVSLLKSQPCITVSKNGGHVEKPCRLINPNGEAAKLFSGEDRRFPVGKHFLTSNRMYVLGRLGMVRDKLPWQEIVERAKTVERLGLEKGRERARDIINYMKRNINDHKEKQELSQPLRCTPFLPLLSETPSNYCLQWKGSSQTKGFATPKELFLRHHQDLVGSSCLILDESPVRGCGALNQSLSYLLGFSDRNPEVKMVLQQLDEAIRTWRHLRDKDKDQRKRRIESVCQSVYKYFEKMAEPVARSDQQRKYTGVSTSLNLLNLLKELSRKPWLFIQGQFVASELVAENWSGNAAPFLYGLPYEYRRDYQNLFRAVGIRKSFTPVDFLTALYELSKSTSGRALTDDELKTAVTLLGELKGIDGDEFRDDIGRIPLPDSQKVLYRSDKLTINLTPWLHDHGSVRTVHPDIPPELAYQLGAKSLQERRLEPYSSPFGEQFGQHERLTDRLANILRGYPCGPEILKELVQNADDAQATEIHFIHDKRVLPHKRVFLEKAHEIQGPALCVYNNRPFTDHDLDAIQKLGVGGKRDDPLTTGQYGIGFNTVYNLTDCPSVLSNGDTLCFFDPECRYVPGATYVSPGRKFHPIDKKFKRDYSDILPGYLGDYLKLGGATIFRLPLRSKERAQESLIAQNDAISRIEEIFPLFKSEARKMLMFLTHVKKISLSVINEHGVLEQEYHVNASLDVQDESKRQQLTSRIAKYKDLPTSQVPWASVTYQMTISGSDGDMERWLIHQCHGVFCQVDGKIPDGRKFGLLPRGGIAALLSSSRISREDHLAYCLLPLPAVVTGLPVHINGHFALDTARRSLWKDDMADGYFTRWNNFIKLSILAPGYAMLIREAIAYIRHYEDERESNEEGDQVREAQSFRSRNEASDGVTWYHYLFPDLSEVESEWKDLTLHFYNILGNMSESKILPVVNGQHITRWVSSKVGFFMDDPENDVEHNLQELLLRIDYPLLQYSPMYIYHGFQEAIGSDGSRLLSPRNVLEFLGTPDCTIETLPRKLEDTKIRSVPYLEKLISYCKNEEEFCSVLNGLPLLLTADCRLRLFDINQPVYCSEFSDLFPTKTDVFLHPKMVGIFRSYRKLAVMHKLTVNTIAQFLPEVFPKKLRGTSRHESWEFRQTGVLSEQWFRRLWEFLQDEAKQESLTALGEWPIIPTTNGNLVTIDNARTVFDFSETGTDGEREKKARKFLKAARCPSLNKAITLKGTRPSVTSRNKRVEAKYFFSQKKPTLSIENTGRTIAVTDPYVAHPYKVLDVLHVLDYMQKMGTLDISDIADEDVFEILGFFQDEYHERHNDILKTLPLYKTFDGSRASLARYRSYAVIPENVPLTEIWKLQHTGFLFLHSDVLPELNKLYRGLGCQVTAWGIGTERSICEFYTKYILPNFSLFSFEGQINFLALIRDKVLPRFPEEDGFWKSMKGIRCIPDHQGRLRRAQEFVSPKNEIYQTMFRDQPDRFPPMRFCDEEWLKLLGRIGLKKTVDQSQFLQFCRDVEKSREVDKTRSKMLVRYFLDKDHLHRSSQFLQDVSTIKFIAAESVELLGLQDGNSNEENARYVQFRGSVTWDQRHLVWTTSSSILPQWAESRCLKLDGGNHGDKLANILGVLHEPTVDTVVANLHNISTTLASICNTKPLLNTDVLKDVMDSIYKFISSCLKCPGSEISTQCTDICKKIGRLKDCPCVYMKKHDIFVTGQQLSFTVLGRDDEFKPFIYTIPREYGNHEHFLKRIGATEKMSLDQVVNTLKEIKNQCKDETILDDHKQLTKRCMYTVFTLIVDDGWEMSKTRSTELFLPSQDDYLIRSNELVCQVPSHLAEIPLSQHVLLPFSRCCLERGRHSDYIEALPEPLRPKPFNTIVREKLDPTSKNDRCIASDRCTSKRRLVKIIGSQEFQDGIMRLMRHQALQTIDKLKEMASRFSCGNAFNPGGIIKCMKRIKVRLVDIESESVIEGSSKEHDCYVVVNRDKTWTLYIKHGPVPFGLLSKCLNEIIDFYLEDKSLQALVDMLSYKAPEKLSRILDDHDIEKDFSDEFSISKEFKQALEKLGTDKSSKSSSEGHSGGSGGGGWGRVGGQCTMRTEYLIDDTDYTTPNPAEAKRWMNQSSIELEAAQFLLSRSRFYALVCFLCHQIVEKSLKAALYAKQGLNSDQLHTHNVKLLHQALHNATDALIIPVNQVADYYLTTRYPNRQPGNLVPAEQFNEAQAAQAVKAAESIKRTIESFYM